MKLLPRLVIAGLAASGASAIAPAAALAQQNIHMAQPGYHWSGNDCGIGKAAVKI